MMDIAFIRLVLLTGCWVSIYAIIETCGMKIALRSKKITAKSLWEQNGVWDKLACAVVCMREHSCKTFMYSRSLKTCLGYSSSLNYYEKHLTDAESGDSIVVGTCRAATTHGKSCRGNDECSIPNSVCYHGVCLCELGLYFSPNQNTCLKKCAEYGAKMDIYKGAGINGYNDKTLHFFSLVKCCEACVQEKSFICLTAEYKEKLRIRTCQLSRQGYLDVAVPSRETDLAPWILAQRQCIK